MWITGWLWLYLSFPLFRLVSGNIGSWVWVCTLSLYKLFTKKLGSLAKRRPRLGPVGVINCTPLSTLTFWVSLFPRTHGFNRSRWCLHRDPWESERQVYQRSEDVEGVVWGKLHETPMPEKVCRKRILNVKVNFGKSRTRTRRHLELC